MKFSGSKLKIERAKKHISDLRRDVLTFFDVNPYKIGTKLKPEISHYLLYIESIEPIPDNFSLLVGDAVHNLRTALDHLACQLVEAGGGTPNRDTYFPIYGNPNGAQRYASAIGKGEINKMPIGAEKAINAVQPYITGDDTLLAIHQLDIADKHKLIIPVYGVPSRLGLKNPKIWLVDMGWRTAVKVGDELTNIPVSTYEQSRENIDFGFYIAFGEPEILKGKSVLETLDEMAVFVDNLIGNFEPFFRG